MARGRPRIVRLAASPEPVIEQVAIEAPIDSETMLVPSDWRKGALLNVRNYGDRYVITLWPEEYSEEKLERAIEFTNVGKCQDWVSDWYSRQTHDPRAR